MKLIVDIGNSGTKMVIYEGNRKVAAERSGKLTRKAVDEVLWKYRPVMAIVSSVMEIPVFLTSLMEKNLDCFHILSSASSLPFKIMYETPGTLGPDRIAGVAGGAAAFPGHNLLIIDAGSAITFDLLINGEYQGGSISPGTDMRFRALNKFTRKLPLVKRSENVSIPARTTELSINAGVISGVVFEINEYIRTFVTKYPDIKVIITGGDAAFLKGFISYSAEFLPDIVTDGLNYILDKNAN